MKITSIKQPFDSAQDDRKKKITDIRPQVKRANRYSVFVDEKYSFSLSESELISSGVHSRQELTLQTLIGC